MLSDSKRTGKFKDAINKVCKGKIVLESGCGTGVLSILAARADARKVFAVELDPEISKIAQANVNQNDLSSVIKIIQKDILELVPADIKNLQPEVVIAENMSTWSVVEPQIPIMNFLNEHFAAENCVRLPTGLKNYLELANTQYDFEDGVELKSIYYEFSGIKKSEILSDKVICQDISFSETNPLSYKINVVVDVTTAGIVNSLRLTSVLKIFKEINYYGSDSLIPPSIVPIKLPLQVKAGDKVFVSIEYQSNAGWKNFQARAQLVDISSTKTQLP